MVKLTFITCCLLLSASPFLAKAETQTLNFSSSKSLEIMAWNVENLFDTKHDEGKDDWTFLPSNTPGKNEACALITIQRYREECFETDWNDEKLNLKLEQIKDVVTRERTTLPDVLALSEIENENVIAQLAKKLGYTSFTVSNSEDARGIDLALLWNKEKLKKVSKREHKIKSRALEGRETRNILEVEFLVNENIPLTIFVNHWPSQGNKNESRMDAAKTLMKRIAKIKFLNRKMNILATGDFNVIETNRPDPFFDIVEKKGMSNVHDLFMESSKIDYKLKMSYPLGTYFYGKNMEWNLLDRFYINENLMNGRDLELDLASYKIHAPKFMTTQYEYTYKTDHHYGSVIRGVPLRYEHNTSNSSRAGYSDHFPIIVNLKY